MYDEQERNQFATEFARCLEDCFNSIDKSNVKDDNMHIEDICRKHHFDLLAQPIGDLVISCGKETRQWVNEILYND